MIMLRVATPLCGWVLLFVFSFIGEEAAAETPAESARRVTQIIAHRGASAERPECTLSSIQRAIEVAATAVEVDVRTSRDGKLFILHDATLDRTTDGSGLAGEQTLAQLQKLDAGSFFDSKYRGERIPSLREAAEACRGKIDLLLDLKEQGDEYDRRVVAVVREYGDPTKTIVGVRSVDQAKRFRQLLPKAKQLALIPNVDSIESFADVGVDVIRLWPRWLKDGDEPVDRVRATGKKLHVNGTLGAMEETLELLAHRPDSLSSDHPQRLRNTLKAIMADGAATARVAPNVVIFLADDMGMGDTSAYQDWTGNADNDQLHTPALDRLARMGVRFTDAHSPHSRCTTTRYALMSGRYCWRTRLKHWVLFGVHGDPLLDKPRVTMPEFLRDAGYRTGMVGKWHLGLTYRRSDGSPAQGWDDADLTQPLADCPIDHGFDFFYGVSRSHGTSGPNGVKNKNTPTQARGPGWMEGRKVVGATGNGKQLDDSYKLNRVGDVLDRQAFRFLESAVPSKAPFFLYFASPANHAPYTPSVRLGDQEIAGHSKLVDGTPAASPRLDFIYQNDVHVARLVKYLEETDDPRRHGHALIENTLFIFASDNGAERPSKQFTGPLRSNKGSVFEGGHRVPFIASWPLGKIGDGDSESVGATRDSLVSLTDVYATLAEILDRPLPPVTGPARGAEDSLSQLAAMRVGNSTRKVPVFPNDHNEASRKLADERAWVAVRSNATPIAGEWKLLLDHRYAFRGELHPQALYNLKTDLREQQDLLTDPAAAPALKFLLNEAKTAAGNDGYSRVVDGD